MAKSLRPPLVRKGKLVVVDLAGSERIDKSGNEIRSTKLSPLSFNCLINDGPMSTFLLVKSIFFCFSAS